MRSDGPMKDFWYIQHITPWPSHKTFAMYAGVQVAGVLRRPCCMHFRYAKSRIHGSQVWQTLLPKPENIWSENQLDGLDDTCRFCVTKLQYLHVCWINMQLIRIKPCFLDSMIRTETCCPIHHKGCRSGLYSLVRDQVQQLCCDQFRHIKTKH